jgi:hypothetical protein
MNTNYEKDFVPYEQALELKKLGFDEPCFGYYLEDGTWTPASYSKKGTVYPSNTDLLPDWSAAPLFQQAFRWFREKHGLSGNIDCCDKLCEWNIKSSKLDKSIFSNNIQSYEEAELACLKNLIEIVNQQP